jgi:hypothetical protein
MTVLAISGMAVQEEPQRQDAPYQFFAGTVVEVRPGALVVGRTVIGSPPENRTFIMTGDTKVEGRLRVKARVTVGYISTDQGDVAARVIVRADAEPRK